MTLQQGRQRFLYQLEVHLFTELLTQRDILIHVSPCILASKLKCWHSLLMKLIKNIFCAAAIAVQEVCHTWRTCGQPVYYHTEGALWNFSLHKLIAPEFSIKSFCQKTLRDRHFISRGTKQYSNIWSRTKYNYMENGVLHDNTINMQYCLLSFVTCMWK